MARQVGRPRKAGERYASGDLKSKRDEGDVRAPTLWRRIKDGAVRGAAHPYAGTVLGRLSIFGALSDAEVEAGFRVAEIVGRYQEAGADELIVPDFTLGKMARKNDTCDLFMQEVAAAFR